MRKNSLLSLIFGIKLLILFLLVNNLTCVELGLEQRKTWRIQALWSNWYLTVPSKKQNKKPHKKVLRE